MDGHWQVWVRLRKYFAELANSELGLGQGILLWLMGPCLPIC